MARLGNTALTLTLSTSMRTLGAEVAEGRWGRPVVGRGPREPLAVGRVAVLARCTASDPAGATAHVRALPTACLGYRRRTEVWSPFLGGRRTAKPHQLLIACFAKYAQTVGYCRSPGHTATTRRPGSDRDGPCCGQDRWSASAMPLTGHRTDHSRTGRR